MAGQVYPDQSLYPVNSVPMLVERINNALQRADQIEHAEGHVTVSHWILCLFLALHSQMHESYLSHTYTNVCRILQKCLLGHGV